jgi:hypothetical protein
MTATNKEDHGPTEDPLSIRLEAYFLQNIVPKLAATAREEAIAAVGDYIREVEQARIALHEDVSRELAEVAAHLADLDRKARALESVPGELRAVLAEGREELSRRTTEAEKNAQQLAAQVLSKQEIDLKGLERRRDELAAATLDLVQAGRALKSESADFTTNALALFKADIDRLVKATDSAREAAVAALGDHHEKLLGKLEERLTAIIRADASKAATSSTRKSWRSLLPATWQAWSGSALYLVLTALLVVIVIWAWGRSADPEVESHEKSPPPAATATSDPPPAAIEGGWAALRERHERALPRCGEAACATFEEAWREEDRAPQAFTMRRRLFVLVLSDFAHQSGCLVDPPANLTEQGDWEATANFANRVIPCLRGAAPPLSQPPRHSEVGRLTRILVARLAPSAGSPQ